MAIPETTPLGEPYPQDSRPQGCIISYIFPNSTGWISFFVLTAPYRGYGMGRELFRACMDFFSRARLEYIGLDSVPEQCETYGRRGFVETNLIAICTRPNVKDIPHANGVLSEGEKLIALKELDPAEIIKSDLAHCGLERTRLWTTEALLHRSDTAGFAVIDENNVLKGWVLVRRCELGYRIGPLYAERKETAGLLLHATMESLEDKNASLIVEIWHSNKDAVPTFEEMGWKWTSSFHRMWFKKRVPAAQSPGGKAEKEMFAIFDAAEG